MEKLSAVGVFIFGGSATFGVEKSGYNVEAILELTDDMKYQNAYHFVKNRPDVPVIDPSQWEQHEYLASLKAKNLDLMYANCPCSGLSQINRNASVESSTNIHFYRLFDTFKTAQPKTFVIENAPTLIKMGYPIVMDMLQKLGDDYKFTIVRDYCGNHGTPMKRMRTLVVGWRRDHFDDKIPLIHMNKKSQATAKDAIGDLYDVPLGSIPNHTLLPDREWQSMEEYFHLVKGQSSIMLAAVEHWNAIKDEVGDETIISQIEKAIEKKANGQNIWDKSPWRPGENNAAPSITSVTELIHPILNRQWTLREYARLMGYPDSFIFYPEESKVDVIQAIAQGVPAHFIEYISGEIKEVLNGERTLINNPEGLLNFQQHSSKAKYQTFTLEELKSFSEKDEKGKTIGLEIGSDSLDLKY